MSVSFTYDDATETWTINRHGIVLVLDLSSVPGNGFNANRREKIRQAAQRELLDTVIAIADLPDDDPDKTTDPGLIHGEKMRWEGDELRSREYILEALDWDGTKLIPTIRKARGL
jgi:hypothetical protein